MYRTKDFLLMDVLNIKNKRIGFIKDTIINFSEGKVTGFKISSYSFMNKSYCVAQNQIITFDKAMIIKNYSTENHLEFSSLKNVDIVDKDNNIIGVVEDIIFDENYFKINAVVVSTGFVRNLIYGKKIILINNLILGEKTLLFTGSNSKINLMSIPHKPYAEVDCDEKDI